MSCFEANTEYYGGRPKLDRVVFRMYPDQKKAWVALLQGEVDAVTDLEREDYLILRNDKRFNTWELPDSFCYSLIFNTRDPLMSQPGIRQAISAAIDRVDLIDRTLEGAGVPANGPFLPGSFYANPDASLQAYDLAKAKKLLADLGWKDADNDWVLEKGEQELVISILVDDGDTIKEAAARRLQWQLLQVGIRAEFEFLPLQQLFGERLFPGKFQAVFMQSNTLGDPDQILNAVLAFGLDRPIEPGRLPEPRGGSADRPGKDHRRFGPAPGHLPVHPPDSRDRCPGRLPVREKTLLGHERTHRRRGDLDRIVLQRDVEGLVSQIGNW